MSRKMTAIIALIVTAGVIWLDYSIITWCVTKFPRNQELFDFIARFVIMLFPLAILAVPSLWIIAMVWALVLYKSQWTK